MQRAGRPKSDKPKDITVKGRIDTEKNKELTVYCQRHNMTVTEVIRKGIDMVLQEEQEQPTAKGNKVAQILK